MLLLLQVTGEMVAIKKFKDSEGFSLCLLIDVLIMLDKTSPATCHNAPIQVASPPTEGAD